MNAFSVTMCPHKFRSDAEKLSSLDRESRKRDKLDLLFSFQPYTSQQSCKCDSVNMEQSSGNTIVCNLLIIIKNKTQLQWEKNPLEFSKWSNYNILLKYPCFQFVEKYWGYFLIDFTCDKHSIKMLSRTIGSFWSWSCLLS